MQRKLLVQKLKGYSFRLLDIDSGSILRALVRKYPSLAIGELLLVEDLVLKGDLIEKMNIFFCVKGDHRKERKPISFDTTKVGDLIDGVPVLHIGQAFYVNDEKKAYAYFNSF